MRKLRWATDGAGGGFWELDMSTPTTLQGQARAVPGDTTLPLGLSRGTRLARPKQIDFMQRFMAAPFVPGFSSSSNGISLQRALTIPFSPSWFATLLAQFNLQQLVYSAKQQNVRKEPSILSRLQTIGTHFRDKSLYALGLSSEIMLTPDDTLFLSADASGHGSNTIRKKAVYHRKFPHHSLTTEAALPGLFVDKTGNYWDVPFTLAVDLASVDCDFDGASYHLCLHHNSGMPKQLFLQGEHCSSVPSSLLPGFLFKSALSFKRCIDLWRSNAHKSRMVQPFDMFLSNPHISASAVIGAAGSAIFGDIAVRSQVEGKLEGRKCIHFFAPAAKSAFLVDAFSSLSITAQHGNFQKLFFDLTRLQAQLDVPSISKFFSSAIDVTRALLNSEQPRVDAIQGICPTLTVSLQQQIAGPFSFRVDSGVAVDLKSPDWHISAENPVLAIEYALQALGSAKAVAWYSPVHKEFMVELRFFES